MKTLKWKYSEVDSRHYVSNNDAYFTIEEDRSKNKFILKDAGREVATLKEVEQLKKIAEIMYNG